MVTQKEIGGISIVAGTAIGASMLALPFATGVAGFWYACLSMVLCYSFSLVTLFLFLEVTLYCKDAKANIISMAHMHLGRPGEIITWITYLILLYTISTSYVTGGGQLLNTLLEQFQIDAGLSMSYVLFTVIFGLVAFQGVQLLDYVNQLLLALMFASYFGLIFNIGPLVSLSKLSGGNPSYIFSSIPTTIAAFACHFVVPSLRKNFSDDLSQLKRMLIIGCSVPLLTYIVYEFLIVSLLPFDGPQGLLAIARSNNQLGALQAALGESGSSIIPALMNSFSNCAILTSFLGVVLALSDFLQDGLGIKGHRFQTLISAALTLGPPLLVALLVPSDSPGFVLALEFSGVVVTFLFGILPVLMAWQARYVSKMDSGYVLPGGKFVLVLLGLLSLGVMFNVVATSQHWLPSPRG